MGATIVHRNPDIFPEPFVFSPERWLQEDSHELEKYLVAFSKGPRSCLGIKCVMFSDWVFLKRPHCFMIASLAWCELYLIFGNLFRKIVLDPKDAS